MSRVVGITGWVLAGLAVGGHFFWWSFLLTAWIGWYRQERAWAVIPVLVALALTVAGLVTWFGVRRATSWRWTVAAWLVVAVLGWAGWATWQWVEGAEEYLAAIMGG